ncbi:hypothetical protein HHK36_011128 [Tetracentron sinense]|uniref:C2H2-type domain-containing protein n=1 Tax=Tetracentron sinense TaxID=13715 RepID=A0A835DGX5_TETSI|nr:hypothetical protein HHK36_011128 [Tetracentron sinense]
MQMMSGDGFSFPSSIKGFAQESIPNPNSNPVVKKKRNLPGTPGKQISSSLLDPDAEVIALSPNSLMATNRFVCEICNKGFQRDQNLQLHRRGHNLPWKLRKRTSQEIRRRVYICPEKTCVHHDPSRALGDLTGIKKHFSRKHGEKKWKCEKCSKKYAVQSDWKAHTKTCGTREYKCDCGTLFSRKDSFITHRAFCDALAEESARNLNFRTDSINETTFNPQSSSLSHGFSNQFCSAFRPDFTGSDSVDPLNADYQKPRLPLWLDQANSHLNPIDVAANSDAYLASTGLPGLVQMASPNLFGSSSMVDYDCIQSQWLDRCTTGANLTLSTLPMNLKNDEANKGHLVESLASSYSSTQNQLPNSAHMSATALLQKAAQMGSTRSHRPFVGDGFREMNSSSTTMAATAMGDEMLGGRFNLSSLMMPGHGKQGDSVPLKLRPCPNEVENSLTRDFLGVGGNSSGRPFLQQELAKIASMGSTQPWT